MRKRVFTGVLVLGLFASSSALADESCKVEKVVGVSPDDADAVEEIVCTELRERSPYAATHRIRLTKLGAKIVLTLVSERPGGARTEKQLILAGLEEVPVAAPRLVEANAEQKPVADTQTVTNIVGNETRVPKKKSSEVHGWLGMVAVGAPGGGTGAGAHVGFSAGSERWSFVGDLRLAGGSELGYVSLSGGVRHHFTVTDVAPFVGMGIALDHLDYDPEDRDSFESENTGVAGYVEVGLDVLRTHVIGGTIALRFDAPGFSLEKERYIASYSATESGRYLRSSLWMPVIGASFTLRF